MLLVRSNENGFKNVSHLFICLFAGGNLDDRESTGLIGALAIPGLGPFIAAGPIMATLAGAGVGGAVGGLTGALVGMGIPEYEAKRYEGRVKDGGILLSVHSDSSEETKRAKEILERTGAQDISSTGEASADKKQLSDSRREVA